MTMNRHDEAIRCLSEGFSSEFAEFCAGHEMMHDLMMDLATEFVETNVPIVKEDDQVSLASELLMSVTVTKV
jgi:hypothetical protein